MCGIVGLAAQSPIARRELLVTMRDTMRHRGPDDAGLWWSADGHVGLAHRRLAVLDLSPRGHQPMTDFSGRLWITLNGEIYNYLDLRYELEARGYRFLSASDTEVVLAAYHAWGVDCLSHLNGMFAFGLYDSVARRMFLARDRAGEKPLFYAYRQGQLIFASELKALMASSAFPRELELSALDHYLAYGYVPSHMCILKGVRKLAQAQAMTYDLATDVMKVWSYWQLPEPTRRRDISANDLSSELEELIEDAVRRQLVADVPVGILLSGGIDSSLVTAMAARSSSGPVKTFTVSFPGHGRFDEGPHAQLVAKHFGTQHTELPVEPTTIELLPELAKQYDEPIADSSMVPTYLVSRLVRNHATVALAGDGADELFGGYPHYGALQREERLRRLLPVPLRRWAGAVAARALPVGVRGRNHIIGFAADLPHSIAHVNMYFDHWTRRRLLVPMADHGESPSGLPEVYRAGLCKPRHGLIRQATEADFRTTMVDDYLVKVDRASMLNALEVRAPWLDYRVVEFAFGRVPDTLRAHDRELKILPRRLAKRLLPPGFDVTRKQGFSLPLMSWFKADWGAYVETVLRDIDPKLFDRRVVQSLIVGQRRGYANTARLFALTLFELWRREYSVAWPGQI